MENHVLARWNMVMRDPRHWPGGRICAVLALFGTALGLNLAAAETNVSYLARSLAKNEPQAIYADDPQDCWNRIFFCLFTRTLKIHLSDDFPEGAPFTFTNRSLTGVKGLSTQLFERIESGDRAVEPLYPHEMFRDDVSTAQLLTEPRFSEFKAALTEALRETSPRSPLERALMQNDVWAAYDFMARDVSDWILKDAPIPLFHQRQGRVARTIVAVHQKTGPHSERDQVVAGQLRRGGKIGAVAGPFWHQQSVVGNTLVT